MKFSWDQSSFLQHFKNVSKILTKLYTDTFLKRIFLQILIFCSIFDFDLDCNFWTLFYIVAICTEVWIVSLDVYNIVYKTNIWPTLWNKDKEENTFPVKFFLLKNLFTETLFQFSFQWQKSSESLVCCFHSLKVHWTTCNSCISLFWIICLVFND